MWSFSTLAYQRCRVAQARRRQVPGSITKVVVKTMTRLGLREHGNVQSKGIYIQHVVRFFSFTPESTFTLANLFKSDRAISRSQPFHKGQLDIFLEKVSLLLGNVRRAQYVDGSFVNVFRYDAVCDTDLSVCHIGLDNLWEDEAMTVRETLPSRGIGPNGRELQW